MDDFGEDGGEDGAGVDDENSGCCGRLRQCGILL